MMLPLLTRSSQLNVFVQDKQLGILFLASQIQSLRGRWGCAHTGRATACPAGTVTVTSIILMSCWPGALLWPGTAEVRPGGW